MPDVVVVGAGPGGLGTARELRRRGVDVLVLDRAHELGSTWRSGYDSLRLNTVRSLSHLPGKRFPRSFGRWVAKDALLAYLDEYVAENDLQLRLGVDVLRVDRVGASWRLETSAGPLEARGVVIATGECNTARLPAWARSGEFAGELLHSSEYRNPEAVRGRDVLVVGTGNSGAEIAVELAGGGAARVRLAMRTPPQIVPRAVLGVPSVFLFVLVRRLPGGIDALVRLLQRLYVRGLDRVGLPHPRSPVSRQFAEHRVVPTFTLGALLTALRQRRIQLVGPVERLEGGRVLLAGSEELTPDVVIAATGYDCMLEPLVGHLGVLSDDGLPLVHGARTHPSAPQLHFTGFTNPITGNLRELRLDARRIGRALAASTERRRRWATSRHPRRSPGQAGTEPSQATAGR